MTIETMTRRFGTKKKRPELIVTLEFEKDGDKFNQLHHIRFMGVGREYQTLGSICDSRGRSGVGVARSPIHLLDNTFGGWWPETDTEYGRMTNSAIKSYKSMINFILKENPGLKEAGAPMDHVCMDYYIELLEEMIAIWHEYGFDVDMRWEKLI